MGSPPSDAKLVIVGGGLTGASMAKISQDSFNVTVIEKRDAMVIKPAGVRAICTEDYMQPSLVPIEKICPKGKIIRGEAKTIDSTAKKVLLADGQSVPYDYLVIATGGVNFSPCEATGNSTVEMIRGWTATMNNIKNSNECVIVGGGPVGIELAGEIAHWHQKVKVTIIHSGESLCSNSTPWAVPKKKSDKMIKQLKERGVNIMLGERVEGDEEGPITMERLGQHKSLVGPRTIKLKSGKTVSCDLVLWCTGFKPSGDIVAMSAGMQGKVDQKGQVMVNKYLQVEGMSDVFSVGDCNNVAETKMFLTSSSNKGMEMIKAKGQVDFVLANIKAMGKEKPLQEYGIGKNSLKMMITVGNAGVVCGLLPDGAVSAKGGDLMTVQVNGDYGNKIKKPPGIPKRALVSPGP